MGELYRKCFNCDHFRTFCFGLWPGRKVIPKLNTCKGHSEGGDHIVVDSIKYDKKLSKEETNNMRQLFKDGMTVTQIALEYNVSYARVYNYVKDLKKAEKLFKINPGASYGAVTSGG